MKLLIIYESAGGGGGGGGGGWLCKHVDISISDSHVWKHAKIFNMWNLAGRKLTCVVLLEENLLYICGIFVKDHKSASDFTSCKIDELFYFYFILLFYIAIL